MLVVKIESEQNEQETFFKKHFFYSNQGKTDRYVYFLYGKKARVFGRVTYICGKVIIMAEVSLIMTEVVSIYDFCVGKLCFTYFWFRLYS